MDIIIFWELHWIHLECNFNWPHTHEHLFKVFRCESRNLQAISSFWLYLLLQNSETIDRLAQAATKTLPDGNFLIWRYFEAIKLSKEHQTTQETH